MKQMIKASLLAPLLCITALVAREPECRTLELNLGPIVNYARYDYDCVPKIGGALLGLHFDFEHSMPCREYILFRFDGKWSAGELSKCDQELKVRDYRTELDLGYNFEFDVCDKTINIAPYIGLGFFYLQPKLEPQCTKPRYYNLFVPVGFKYESVRDECFKWGINAEYRIDAWTRLRMSHVLFYGDCDKQKLHKRTHGVLLEVPLTWQLHEHECFSSHIKVVPFFDWNRFGRTKIDDCSITCCEDCSSFCSDSCSSSCSVLPPACWPLKATLGTTCSLPQLTQWYLGLHIDLGIRF